MLRIFPLLVLSQIFAVLSPMNGWTQSQTDANFSESDGWKTRMLTFTELRDGQLSNAGANLFLSHSGALTPIHSWDANADGYADIVFNNTHDHAFEIPVRIYLNRDGLPNAESFMELPGSGASSVTAADLNGDGSREILVINGNNNTTGHQDSMIYWGGKSGWDPSRRTALPSLRGDHATVADWNADGFPDVVIGNRGDKPGEDKESYVYWGDGKGFETNRRTVLRTNHATASVATDANRDGHLDLIFANRGNESDDGSLVIYWGGTSGLRNSRYEQLGSQKGTGLASADLDGDGWMDLVISDLRPAPKNQTGIYYGSEKGYSAKNFVPLPAADASATAAGDFDGDGKLEIAITSYRPNRQKDGEIVLFQQSGARTWKESARLTIKEPTALCAGDINGDGMAELAVAEQNDGNSKSISSRLFLGGRNGLSPQRVRSFPTFGAADVLMSDVDGNGRTDLLFANWSTGRTFGDIDSYVYWGNTLHDYSPKNRTSLPTLGAYNSVMSDFNGDGITDVLIATSGEDDPKNLLQRGSSIFLGSAAGLSPDRRMPLPVEARGFGATTADLNRDGWLDVVFGDLYGNCTRIYYGTADGYRAENVRILNAGGAFFVRTVDLNGDGLLDIVTPRIRENRTVIFWNSPDGFHEEDIQEIKASGPVVTEFADLNADGWLDMIVAGFWDASSNDHRASSSIYWGGPDGYTNYRSTQLYMSGAADVSVADLNRDSHLDIVFSNYHGNSTREVDSFVYWGDGRDFSDARRTALPTFSASGNLVLDLNEDSWPDIVFANHNRNNDHHTDSMIYWGSAEGFSPSRVTWLPAVGPHQMADADAGNLMTRKMEETYVSPPIDLGDVPREIAVSWQAETPRKTALEVSMRVSNSRESLAKTDWGEPLSNGQKISPKELGRFAQYKVAFQSATGAAQARLLALKIHTRQ